MIKRWIFLSMPFCWGRVSTWKLFKLPSIGGPNFGHRINCSLGQLGWQRGKELAQGSRLVCHLSWIRIPFRLHRFGAWWFGRGSHISLMTFLCSDLNVKKKRWGRRRLGLLFRDSGGRFFIISYLLVILCILYSSKLSLHTDYSEKCLLFWYTLNYLWSRSQEFSSCLFLSASLFCDHNNYLEILWMSIVYYQLNISHYIAHSLLKSTIIFI